MKSRKSSSMTTHVNKTPFSSAASTTAAAFSVTRFGQATFTSVRRQDRENASSKHFVPFKTTKSETNEFDYKFNDFRKNEVSNPKPKVYKFFKSRVSEQPSVQDSSSSISKYTSPKPLVINNFTKKESVKRSQDTKMKNERNSRMQSNNNTTRNLTETLIENKSCQIKICGDMTIKKIISPTKTTEFIIRNSNSNVRNATVPPKSTLQILQPPSNRGIRSSRRLQGIAPESVQSKSNNSTMIHLVYDKKNKGDEKNSITTSIDVIEEEQHDNSNSNHQMKVSFDDDIVDDIDKTGFIEDKIDLSDNISEENDLNLEADNEKIIDSNESNNIGSSNYTEIVEKNPKIFSINVEPSNEPILENSEECENSNEMNWEEQKPTENSEIKELNEIQEQKETALSTNNNNTNNVSKPKKKIFSNRGRSKVEFNTKSFFASSDMKDEFEIELDKSSQSSVVDNKKQSENDDNEDAYVKLKRVKKAHQCHELGETEQFDQDIKYYLSGIVSKNSNSLRCLSILGLTQQTMRPEFRMHLRAHDDMPRIIKALMDAPQDSNLALCTACLMFIYNQDRLTMDIDPNALSIMLELLQTRSDECNSVEEKHRIKVKSMVEEMKSKGHAQYLKLDEITAGKLAMETFLGLTSKRAGDWFKTELRKMKGIDFIVNTVLRCAENYDEEGQMVKIDRCMHVLENVTFNNIENQHYITNYNGSKHFIETCIKLLELCKHKIISLNESKVFLSAFFSILRVLTNLTSESAQGCEVVGSFEGIIELLLEALFELPSFIMSDQRFDLMVIILCLCINLAQFCQHIRDIIMGSENYMNKLSEFLFKKIDEAIQVEQQTDHLLESHETVQMTEAMQDNLLMQMISKSGTHMEHSLLSACVCLLFGCSIQDSNEYMNKLKKCLPNNSFKPLIEQLEKLRDFAHLADIMTQKGKDRVQKVLQLFKSFDKQMNLNSI